MILKTVVLAGGLLALVLGAVFRFKRSRSTRITTEQVSGDWLAQARAREEHHPW